MPADETNLPAQIADAISSIPKALTPAAVKALDRLIGAAVDIPVAWLQQRKAKIEAQTESYRQVEASIGQAVASFAGGDVEVAQRAFKVLVRKEYRKQTNREAVAAAMIEDLSQHASPASDAPSSESAADLDEDWLNVFERYAEDASSERLQGLWGRVLAGEIRRPGRFSTRTLRFFSEFSQSDALAFEAFSKNAFGNLAPSSLVKDGKEDIKDLIYLESSGLIQGAAGHGLQSTISFNDDGCGFYQEGDLFIIFKGERGTSFTQNIIALTPLGQEALVLVASRNPLEAARTVALATKFSEIKECYIGAVLNKDANYRIQIIERLWRDEATASKAPDGVSEGPAI